MEGEVFCVLFIFRKFDGNIFEQDVCFFDVIVMVFWFFCLVKVVGNIMDEYGILFNCLIFNIVWIKGKFEDYILFELEALLQQVVEWEDY